jgi:hypothetical protein
LETHCLLVRPTPQFEAALETEAALLFALAGGAGVAPRLVVALDTEEDRKLVVVLNTEAASISEVVGSLISGPSLTGVG